MLHDPITVEGGRVAQSDFNDYRTPELSLTFSAAGPPKFEALAAQADSRGYRVLRDSPVERIGDPHPHIGDGSALGTPACSQTYRAQV